MPSIDPAVHPETRPVDISTERLTQLRLAHLEDARELELFREEIYYPYVIKTERTLGELTGRISEQSARLDRIEQKTDNAVMLVNDFDARIRSQLDKWNTDLKHMMDDMQEIKAAYKDTARYIAEQKERDEDRKIILNRSQRAAQLLIRIVYIILAGTGGGWMILEFVKLLSGAK